MERTPYNNHPTICDFLAVYATEQRRDIEFLRHRGWKQCDGEQMDIPGMSVKCNSIWKHPERDEKYIQIAKFGGPATKLRRAVDVANEDFLRELGWKEVRVRIHHISTSNKEEAWFIHPETKRIYNHQDTIKIARDSYNDEQVMCLFTNRLNELVDGNRLKEGDLLCFDCSNGVYELWD